VHKKRVFQLRSSLEKDRLESSGKKGRISVYPEGDTSCPRRKETEKRKARFRAVERKSTKKDRDSLSPKPGNLRDCASGIEKGKTTLPSFLPNRRKKRGGHLTAHDEKRKGRVCYSYSRFSMKGNNVPSIGGTPKPL